MPPFLPPELVTITFDHLYDSLCYSPGRGTYETPIGAGFVFSHLSLVSKTWHSLALPFLVRNFEDASRSGAKVAQYLHHLRKYDLSKHVQSVAVTLRSENGKSKCPLVQELFAEVGPVWKPRMVQIDSDDKEEFTGRECLAASLPFFRDTSSLRLIDIDFSFPRQWIPHLPARLAILECRYILRATDDEYLSTSLQLEIARICSQTLRVLRICRHPLSWSSRAQALFGGTVFPFLTDLHLFGVLCSKLDVSYHFPQLRSVSLPLSLVPSGLPLSNLPRSLQSLTFYDVNKLNFDTIVDGLKNLLIPVESLKNFRLSAKFTFDEDPDVFESICELSEHLKCVVVSDLCKERRIRLSCHEWDPILGDALETVETETTDEEFGVPAFAEEELEYVEREEEADETTSDEEEDLDFDAEDGVEFRHLWSEEKLAELAQEEKVCSD